ncbi:MAG: hypothetical protein IPJ87_14875 [Flavobacteriales bacterium]|jgi:hypothetical protein|nr:hypothetical protein [Flavobacteriales bacterium]MBK7943133.1 hypothetical protein [Flavobacteriales bacterium]MBK8947367.1 hypothetical protein [Flavobacteriales bacterium]MBK9701814.1 hypothetical protein [Flavobacteriales bacterium]
MKALITLLALALASGLSAQERVAGHYTYRCRCIGVELDGSQTILAWGQGRNRFDAVEQAQKNAVNEVLFNGIREGQPGCEQRPLLFEVNAREKYEDYFNTFFADDGPYKKFVSLKDERIGQKYHRNKKKAEETKTVEQAVRVLRAELKQKLITDGILK